MVPREWLSILLAITFSTLAAAAEHSLDFSNTEDRIAFRESFRPKAVYIRAYPPGSDHLPSEQLSQGSGVLLNGRYVLTSLHLADGDPRQIDFAGALGSADRNREKALTFIAEVPDHDLLLLRFDPADDDAALRQFACVRAADKDLQVEESIAIFGFSLGGALDPRWGSISRLEPTELHTSANVSHGHSGSPVFDAEGRVIGIVRGELTLQDGQGGQADEDIATIVPIDLARPILMTVPQPADPACRTTSSLHTCREISSLPSSPVASELGGALVLGRYEDDPQPVALEGNCVTIDHAFWPRGVPGKFLYLSAVNYVPADEEPDYSFLGVQAIRSHSDDGDLLKVYRNPGWVDADGAAIPRVRGKVVPTSAREWNSLHDIDGPEQLAIASLSIVWHAKPDAEAPSSWDLRRSWIIPASAGSPLFVTNYLIRFSVNRDRTRVSSIPFEIGIPSGTEEVLLRVSSNIDAFAKNLRLVLPVAQ